MEKTDRSEKDRQKRKEEAGTERRVREIGVPLTLTPLSRLLRPEAGV